MFKEAIESVYVKREWESPGLMPGHLQGSAQLVFHPRCNNPYLPLLLAEKYTTKAYAQHLKMKKQQLFNHLGIFLIKDNVTSNPKSCS